MFHRARTFIATLVAFSAVIALATISFVVGSASAAPTTLTVNAIADTYVSKHDPDSNYGSKSSIWVSQNSYLALLRFQVSLPDGASVTSVSLRVYSNSTASGSLVVNQSSNAWDEMTVTYSNRPTSESTELGH